jgi:endonuclease/exonuclease/phosphatase (EEP) superfamily protein YafD
MESNPRPPNPLEEIDLHIVAMVLFLIPLGWVASAVVGWYWAVGLTAVVPQGRILVRATDLPKFGRPWRSYFVANEFFVLACACLQTWLAGGFVPIRYWIAH